MKNKFQGRKIFIGGIQGSGKTVRAKHIVKKYFRSVLSLQMTADYEQLDNVTSITLDGQKPLDVLEKVCKLLNFEIDEIDSGKKKDPVFDCLLVDEFDMVIDNKSKLPPGITEFNAKHRHGKIALIMVTRRMQDIPSKIVESAHHKYFYPIEGKNAYRYIGDIHRDIPEMMEKLSFDRHDCVYKELSKEPKILPACPYEP